MSGGQLNYNGIQPADRFTFEENFDVDSWVAWVKDHRALSLYVAAVYVLLVFSGRRWMEHRQPYRLKVLLILWNVLLGGFSLFGVWRSVPVLATALYYNGWHSTVCDNVYYHKDFVGIWGLLFTLSKIPELGDTFFIVLRKQKLMFLHWYHHASVPLFVFAVYGDRAAPGVWFTAMNYFVHGLMYPYFGVRAAGYRLPKFVAMTITSLQIVQMLMGNVLVIHAAVMHFNGVSCHISHWVLAVSIALYFSYMVLFAQFFHSAYFGSKRAPIKPDSQSNGSTNGVKVHPINTDADKGLRKREFDRNENTKTDGRS
ncbi:elongation of very long chain fatty acids protein 6-like [Patiria miniata]|uniref:Elongation of very long chain fatty acids protein n=1 Tax=Patiria miniata TaxID=46514 RepID=A0A913ZNM1_PATMI|nr:elongation of very long chain fatty acids protein 6-like [Patiria miniata]